MKVGVLILPELDHPSFFQARNSATCLKSQTHEEFLYAAYENREWKSLAFLVDYSLLDTHSAFDLINWAMETLHHPDLISY